MPQPDLELLAAALGAPPHSWERITSGGYTRSERWRVETADGRAFVKQAEDEGSLHMLRREAVVYADVHGSFLPGYVGFADSGTRAVLAIELLEHAHWPPPYPDDTTPLFDSLEPIAAAPVPPGLPALSQPRRWEEIAVEPEPLLGLGVCTREWLDRSLPTLIAAEKAAAIEGDDLVHGDVYSGNIGFVDSRAVLVDWGACVRGSRWTDVAFAVLSVRVEGGILPTLAFPEERAYAAATAGLLALEAPKPLPEWSPPDSRLRQDMTADLGHALRWAAEELELPLP